MEVGSLDYGPGTDNISAHYAAATPSGNWVYLEDEIGVGGSGGVHVLGTHTCDGTAYCTPVEVGYWHINGHPVQAAAYHGRGSGAINGFSNLCTPRLLPMIERGEEVPAISALVDLLLRYPVTPGIKALVAHVSRDSAYRRTAPPLVDLPDADARTLVAAFDRLP